MRGLVLFALLALALAWRMPTPQERRAARAAWDSAGSLSDLAKQAHVGARALLEPSAAAELPSPW